MESMNVKAIKTFRRSLRQHMKVKGISQRELASKAKLSYPYLNRILKAKADPSLTICDNIADALGVNLAELIEGELLAVSR